MDEFSTAWMSVAAMHPTLPQSPLSSNLPIPHAYIRSLLLKLGMVCFLVAIATLEGPFNANAYLLMSALANSCPG